MGFFGKRTKIRKALTGTGSNSSGKAGKPKTTVMGVLRAKAAGRPVSGPVKQGKNLGQITDVKHTIGGKPVGAPKRTLAPKKSASSRPTTNRVAPARSPKMTPAGTRLSRLARR